MDVLAVLRKILPEEYLSPLLADRQSAGLIHGIVAVLQRAADTVDELEASAFVLDAPSGTRSRVSLLLTPKESLASVVVVKAGSLFSDAGGHRIYRLVSDVEVGPAFTPGDAYADSVTMSAAAEAAGEFTSLRGETVDGDITEVVRLTTVPPFGCDLVVRQVSDSSGGSFPALEALARDVGVFRRESEDVDSFRTRAWENVEVTSPDAIVAALNKLFAPVGVVFIVSERIRCPALSRTEESYARTQGFDSYTAAYDTADVLDGNEAEVENPLYAPTPGYDTVPGRYARGLSPSPPYIVVTAHNKTPLFSRHLVLSDEALTEGEVTYEYGTRSVCFVSEETADQSLGCLSGADDALDSLYAGAEDMLTAIKAGGVAVFLDVG